MKSEPKMKINQLFEYKDLTKITNEETGSRYYEDPEGNHLSSVTTILSATGFNPELDAWKERVGEKESKRICNEACALGSLMHSHLEKHIQKEERSNGSNLIHKLARNMADQVINRGFINVNEVWGIESVLYWPGLYAGTTDLVGVHNGQPAIMDYKTCRKMKTKNMISDYAMQISAYALSHNELFGTDIQKGVIFMVDRDLNFEEYIFEGYEWEQAKMQWFKRLELFLNGKINDRTT